MKTKTATIEMYDHNGIDRFKCEVIKNNRKFRIEIPEIGATFNLSTITTGHYEGGGMFGSSKCSIALHRFKKAKIFVGQTVFNGKLTMLRLSI